MEITAVQTVSVSTTVQTALKPADKTPTAQADAATGTVTRMAESDRSERALEAKSFARASIEAETFQVQHGGAEQDVTGGKLATYPARPTPHNGPEMSGGNPKERSDYGFPSAPSLG